MADKNFNFAGSVPSNASIQNNIKLALDYKATHTPYETAIWFKSMVQNNGKWDYKQKDSAYEDFGNFNYGVIGKALGFSEPVILAAAGGAQFVSDHGALKIAVGGKTYEILSKSNTFYATGFADLINIFGTFDDPKDQIQISKGIQAAKESGYVSVSFDETVAFDVATTSLGFGSIGGSSVNKPYLLTPGSTQPSQQNWKDTVKEYKKTLKPHSNISSDMDDIADKLANGNKSALAANTITDDTLGFTDIRNDAGGGIIVNTSPIIKQELINRYGDGIKLFTDNTTNTEYLGREVFTKDANGAPTIEVEVLAIVSKTSKGLTLIDANDGSSVTISSSGTVTTTPPLPIVDTPQIDTATTTGDATSSTQPSDTPPPPSGEAPITTTPNTSTFADKQFTTALGMQGPQNLTPINLGNTTLFKDADGKIVGELTQVEGNNSGIAKYTDSQGNSTYIKPDGKTMTELEYQGYQAKGVVDLANSFIGLQNWANETNLQKVATVASIYNQIDHLGGGGVVGSDNLPGELGSVVAGLGLDVAIESGDGVAIVTNSLMFAECEVRVAA